MNDIERVKQMVDEGRITSAEGERLITILSEVEAGDAALQAAVQEASAAEPQVLAPLPAAAAVTPPPAEDTASAPDGLRWVRIVMLAGDLGVSVDGAIREPVASSDVNGDLEVETTPDGFTVRLQPKEAGFIDHMLGGFRSGRVDLRIPVGYGADIAATAGNIDLDGVPYLRGKLTAGDLDAVGLQGIDFTTMAGDVDVSVLLTTGEHRIVATAGDVTIKFQPDCNVLVNGSVSIGDISSQLPGMEAERQGLGQRFSATLGSGSALGDGSSASAEAATLAVRLATGQLNLRADRD